MRPPASSPQPSSCHNTWDDGRQTVHGVLRLECVRAARRTLIRYRPAGGLVVVVVSLGGGVVSATAEKRAQGSRTVSRPMVA